MKIQFNYNGRFRITTDDGLVAGEYAPYQSIATLTHEGKTYIAGSEYGLLPKSETVYELSAVDAVLDSSQEWIDSWGKDHSEEMLAYGGVSTASFLSGR